MGRKNTKRDYGYSRRKYEPEGKRDYNSKESHGRRNYRRRRDYDNKVKDSSFDGTESYRFKTERNYDNSIFLGNIPFSSRAEDIEAIFENEYDIVRADIVTNRGQSRGMATVEFTNKEDVLKAIEKFDHYEYQGREIFVRQDYPPPEKKKAYESIEGSKILARFNDNDKDFFRKKERKQALNSVGAEVVIGNLPFSMNWQALKDVVRNVGDVIRADVVTDKRGKSKGFGIAVFKSEEEAQHVIGELDGIEIEGRKLDVRSSSAIEESDFQKNDEIPYTEKKDKFYRNTEFTENVTGDGGRTDTIFCSNLPWVTSEEDLYELFETIGRVQRAEVQYNESGRPSGNAVIKFDTEELADLAISNLHMYNYGGRDLLITYATKFE